MIPVVIPYYKNKKQLGKCIEHLNSQNIPIEIFVRDNTKDNIYFTAAVNEGIKHFLNNSSWKYILIVNQDVYLEADALKLMIEFMDCRPKCGISAPIQFFNSGDKKTRNAGGVQTFPVGKCMTGRTELYWANAQIIWASGACMLLRREMVQEIGLLDENFRFVCSDSDYCFTARTRGWQVWRVAKAKCVHEKGQAFKPSENALQLIKINDILYYTDKWLTGALYRQNAYSDEDTTVEAIDKEIDNLTKTKEELKRRMSDVES